MENKILVTGSKYNRNAKLVLSLLLGSIVVVVMLVLGLYPSIQVPRDTAEVAAVSEVSISSISKSVFDKPILMAVLRKDGAYSFARIENATLSENSYVGEVELTYQNGDSGIVTDKNGMVDVFISKLTPKQEAFLLDRAVTGVVLPDDSILPVRLVSGNVIRGKIVGDFELLTLTDNKRILGKFDTRGKISQVLVENSLAEPDVTRTQISKELIRLAEVLQGNGDSHVLGVSTDKPMVLQAATGAPVAIPIQGVVASFNQVERNVDDGSLVVSSQTIPVTAPVTVPVAVVGAEGPQGPVGPQGPAGDGDITGVAAGEGIQGGGDSGGVTLGVKLTGTGTAGSSQTSSGMELSSNGLSLLTGCSNGQVLSWNSGNSSWECSAGGGGGGTALSSLTAATAANSINSADNAQTWNWNLTTAAKTAFTFGENSASTNGAGSQYILGLSTLAGSTASPLKVSAGGNTIIDTGATGDITLGNTTANTVITVQSGTGAINVGTDANSKTLTLGNSTGATAVNINSGTGGISLLTGTTGALSLKTGTTGAVTLDSGTTGAVNVGTGASAKTVTIGNSTGATNVNLLAGTGNVTVGTSDTTGTLLVLDTKTDAGDPTGVNGGLYYNSNTNKFRCYQNGSWSDCVGGAALSSISAATTANSINSGDNAQVWNWNLTTAAKTAFTFGENTASTNGAGSQYILGLSTLTGSTAAPLTVSARGNTIIDTTSTGALTFGNTTANTPITLQSGTGAINVGTDANAKTISVGNTTGATAVNFNTGTGGTTYTTTNGIFTLNTGTGTINLGTDAAAKTINVGNSTGATAINLNTGTGSSLNLGTNAVAHTVTLGNVTGATAVNIDTGTGGINFGDNTNTKTIDIGGVTNSGTDTINIASNGTAADVITIGNSNAATTLALTGGDDWSISTAGLGTYANLIVNGLTANSGVYTNGSKQLTSTPPTSGTLGYWSRTGTTLSPATSGDAITTSGNISTTGTGTITSAGLMTASNGLTLTTGAINLTGTSGSLSLSGLSASSINTGENALTFTSSNFNTTATGINSTNIGATTAGTGAFTTLSSTGLTSLGTAGASNVNIATTGTGNVAVGNATGTFALTSSGGLNVTTGGALTGVASIDTIGVTATALSFAGAGTITSNTTSALTLDSGTTGAVNLGTGNNAKTINIGTGTVGNTINIGTNNTTLDTIAIGSALDSLAISSANWSVTSAGLGTFSNIIDTGLAINSGVYTNGSSQLTTTAPTSGNLGFWNRTGTTLSPATSGDAVTTSGNISTTGTGTITSAGLLTASNGFTQTSGALNLTATSGTLSLSGMSASSLSFGANALTFTATNFNTTATGINSTNIGATTAGTGAFTTLSSTGTTNLGQGTGVVTLNSSGALNMTAVSASTFTLANVSDALNFDSNTLSIDALNNQVGIGIASQNYKLSVVDSQSGDESDDAVVSFVNTAADGADKSVLRLALGATSDNDNRFITFYEGATTDNDGTGVGRVRLQGGGGGVQYQSGSADVAEYMTVPAAQAVSPGHIIAAAASGNVKATSSNNALIGVVSDTAAFVGNAVAGVDTDPDKQIVGIAGFVSTYVTGTVAIGDPITVSSTAGVGEKATNAGFIVGKAAEAHSGVGPDRILVSVLPGWYDPNVLQTATVVNYGDTATTKSLDIGGVDADGTDTVNISTNSTSPDTITIGNSNASTTVTITGGDDWSMTGAGALTLASLTRGGDTITDFTGNGLAVSSGSLGINLTTSGTTGSTSSNSGLEVSSAGLTLLKGCADGQILKYTDAGGWACAADSSGGSPSFDQITTGTNTTATMTVGTGGSLTFSGFGTINASTLGGATFAAPGAIGSTTPDAGAFTTLSASSTLTASNGLTQTTGALSMTSTSGSINSTGLTGLTQTLSSGTAAITAPTLNLNTSSTGNIAIGNSTGTFALTSSGGLNVTTGGALTGVASIDTVGVSATAFTFAGTGSVTSTGANAMNINGGSIGALNLNGTSTGDILIGGGVGSTGCTITNSTGALACTAGITGSNLSGTNTGDVTLTAIGATPNANGATLTGQALNLQPASASFGGVVTTGTQTFAGAKTFSNTLTASNGLTLTTGALNLTATSGVLSLSGLSASSINTGANALTFTSSNFNTTATGINSTNIGATTAGTGAFTTLSSTGTTSLGQGTGVVTLNSSGALNMTAASASTFTLANVADAFNFDSNTLSIDALNNRIGIGVNNPSAQLDVYTTDGTIRIGNAFPNKAGSTDNGISVFSEATYKAGLFTEVDGALLSYGINVSQIGDRDTTKIGGIFRMDTRANTPYFSVKRQTIGGSTEFSDIQISQAGDIGLGGWASDTNSFPGNVSLMTRAAAVPGLVIMAATGQTADLTEWTNNAGTVQTLIDSAGTLSFTGSQTTDITTSAARGLVIDSGTTGAINIGTGSNAKTITVGNATGATNVNLLAGTGNVTVGTSNTTGTLLVLDTKTNAGDPTGVNGGMYYNSSLGKFRCYESGAWKDCDRTSTRSFLDTSGDAIIDNNTSSYWDTGVENNNSFPNITLSSSGKSIYGVVSVEMTQSGASNGDTSPSSRIEVNSGSVANCNSGTQAGGTIGIFTSNANAMATGTVTFLYAPGSTTTQYFNVCSDSATSGTTGTITRIRVTLFEVDNSNADLAEVYPTNDNTLEPGEVVSIDPTMIQGIKRSDKAYDNNVVGIISTSPALVIGGQDGEGVTGVAVALSGRVPVKVSTENGEIKAGDSLTSSSIPGVAMKATKAGVTIGTAMNGFSGDTVGTVMAFVKNGVGNGSNLADILNGEPVSSDREIITSLLQKKDQIATSSAGLSEIYTDKLTAGLEIITPKVITQDILATGLFVMTDKDGNENVRISSSGDATLSGTLIVDTLRARRIEGMDLITKKLSLLSEEVAGVATQSAGVDTEEVITKVNILDMIAKAIDSIYKNTAEFIGKVIFRNDVLFAGRPTFNKDTAGFALVKSGSNEVEVIFEKEYKNEPIVNISLNIAGDVNINDLPKYAVADVNTKGFKIRMAQPISMDIRFSWMAVAVDNVGKFESNGGVVLPSPTITEPLVTPSITPVVTPVSTESAEVEVTPTLEATPTPVSGSTPSVIPEPTVEVTPQPTPTETI